MAHRMIERIAGMTLIFGLAITAHAGDPPLTTVLITDEISDPIELTHAPGDHSRLFVLERGGVVWIIEDGKLLDDPFLDISDLVSSSVERGLLGIDFHPDYDDNGFFYVRYNNNDGHTTVARYTRSGGNDNVANPNSAKLILVMSASTVVHNGGSIEFGPDGYLYISIGDASFHGNSQDTDSPYGKILRIDVDSDDFPSDPEAYYSIPDDNPFDNEVWSYGLRNPFRFSFDRDTGDLWIGDVGQNSWEEVSVQRAGNSGENYGWPCMEGNHCYTGGDCTCNAPTLEDPVFEYSHSQGCSVTGGRVYRGCAIPWLQGTYFCADYCSERIWTFRYSNGSINELQQRQDELDPVGTDINSIVAFGEDAHGELYICDLGGEIFKIVPVDDPPDKNANGIPDSCEDTEPCDITGDNVLNVDDLLAVINSWGPCPGCDADIAPAGGNGTVNVDDLLVVINNWNSCP